MNKKTLKNPLYLQRGWVLFMNKQKAWEKFKETGKIEYYLKYKGIKQK